MRLVGRVEPRQKLLRFENMTIETKQGKIVVNICILLYITSKCASLLAAI